jgi:HEAT repeat protein
VSPPRFVFVGYRKLLTKRVSAADNQISMASEGGVEMLIALLDTPSLHVQRQAAKALANLGVNGLFISVIVECYASDTHLSAVSNKAKIAQAGGIPPLVQLADSPNMGVSVEAVAALANLAVNDQNEVEIARAGGLEPILQGARSDHEELQSQAARALRNLSVNRASLLHNRHVRLTSSVLLDQRKTKR